MDELQIVIHLFLEYLLHPNNSHTRGRWQLGQTCGETKRSLLVTFFLHQIFLWPLIPDGKDTGGHRCTNKYYCVLTSTKAEERDTEAADFSFFLSLQWTRLDAQHGVGSPLFLSWNLSLSFHQTLNGQAEWEAGRRPTPKSRSWFRALAPTKDVGLG